MYSEFIPETLGSHSQCTQYWPWLTSCITQYITDSCVYVSQIKTIYCPEKKRVIFTNSHFYIVLSIISGGPSIPEAVFWQAHRATAKRVTIQPNTFLCKKVLFHSILCLILYHHFKISLSMWNASQSWCLWYVNKCWFGKKRACKQGSLRFIFKRKNNPVSSVRNLGSSSACILIMSWIPTAVTFMKQSDRMTSVIYNSFYFKNYLVHKNWQDCYSRASIRYQKWC